MLRETGRVFIEAVSVPDEPSGCGCIAWLLGIGVIIFIGMLILQYWVPILLTILGIWIAIKLIKHLLN
ncbi:preprotein translocase, SecE subunit domain protein [Enterococcus sp. BWB1-3]|uniref:preprotein translocase, SecE subunit domain protein n=1 Tax=Enterococcus sp. BWB1-3 TaxID=2787713 RepID=UPI0019204C0F|nr:preprotein translocase, SecE subunit domain protein [Enterococcus sp. BWB1-3]MBL1228023.1 preprotein translocase, SecE subunit domain protein [Enterococcus sp. BWB1-3]